MQNMERVLSLHNLVMQQRDAENTLDIRDGVIKKFFISLLSTNAY